MNSDYPLPVAALRNTGRMLRPIPYGALEAGRLPVQYLVTAIHEISGLEGNVVIWFW
jgi:hypothetical protein